MRGDKLFGRMPSFPAVASAPGSSKADCHVLSERLLCAVLCFLVVFCAMEPAAVAHQVGAAFHNKTDVVRRAARLERTTAMRLLRHPRRQAPLPHPNRSLKRSQRPPRPPKLYT